MRPEALERALALLASLATDTTSSDEIMKKQGVSAVVSMFNSKAALSAR